MLNEELLEMRISNGINCCHNDVLDLTVLGELIKSVLVHKVHPMLPLVLLWEVYVIVDQTSVKGAWQYLLLKLVLHRIKFTVADLLELLIEGASEFSVD